MRAFEKRNPIANRNQFSFPKFAIKLSFVNKMRTLRDVHLVDDRCTQGACCANEKLNCVTPLEMSLTKKRQIIHEW